MLNWKDKEHTYKKWFWRLNYPVALVLFYFTLVGLLDEIWIIFYTLMCSVYANEETSASAEEAKKAQKKGPIKKLLNR